MKAPPPRRPSDLKVGLEIAKLVRVTISGPPAYALAVVVLVLIAVMVLAFAGRL
jgi:hypothetical protein